MRWATVGLAALAAGCIKDTRPTRERGAAALFDRAPLVEAPAQDRCAPHVGAVKASCEEARYLAQLYTRKLGTGDEVCLEGGFGEEPGGACLARAAVVDTQLARSLLEIREARPESRWFQKVQYQVWFDEGALVDLYLAENGY